MKNEMPRKGRTDSRKHSGSRLPDGIPQPQGFFEDVYDLVRQVPPGRVTTYGAIASCLGTRLSARMVGWAMNASHQAMPEVPAQRVVNRNGMLSGKHHFPPDRPMEALLRQEDIDVVDDKVVDFPARFWDPAVELGL